MADSELSSVRAEIKNWERSFKEAHNRPATVTDVKGNKDIAAKYKLYKKLSKNQKSTPPSTPKPTTHQKDPPSLILSHSRKIQPSAPLVSFNPFSPRKAKEKERFIHNHSDELFSLSQRLDWSQGSHPSVTLALNPPPEPTTAVSRARKRLRGEPVSPSPIKSKRRRINSTLGFARLNPDAQGIDDNSQEDDALDADISFVENSPVKFHSPGKLYPKLFQESSISANLFGIKGDLGVVQNFQYSSTQPRVHSVPGRHKPSRRQANDSVADPEASKPINSCSNSISNTSSKRALSDDELHHVNETSRARSPLLPPSPPPSTSNSAFNCSGKNNFKQGSEFKSRKKAKIENALPSTDSDDEAEPVTKLKLVHRNIRPPQRVDAGPNEDDIDPILEYPRFAAPNIPYPSEADEDVDDNVEIDLREELRRVLAFQPTTSKTIVLEENRLVKGLLYGQRVTHYDSQKGGEIWDVGEENAEVFNKDEQDWESEPVPWEVGEL